MKPFTVEAPVTEKGYRSAARCDFWKGKPFTVFVYVLGAALSAALLLMLYFDIFPGAFVVVCDLFVLAALLFNVVIFEVRLQKNIEKNKDVFGRVMKLTFTESLVHCDTGEAEADFAAEQISRIIKTKHYLHIYLKTNGAALTVCPKDQPLQSELSLYDWANLMRGMKK